MSQHLYTTTYRSSGLQFEVAYRPTLAVGGAAQLAATYCPTEFELAACSSTNQPMPQPATLSAMTRPSPHNVLNVLQQQLTVFVPVASITR